MSELLTKVKENLILEHSVDDGLIERFITAAVSYAESYQHIKQDIIRKMRCPLPRNRP